MTKAIVIGDGPGGLSAALFLAKNGVETVLFAQDKTAMHYALLKNYLGIPEMTGSDFQTVARSQVQEFGTDVREEAVARIAVAKNGFTVSTDTGERLEATYVVLAEGKSYPLAKELALAEHEYGLVVDVHCRTAIAGLYAVGRSTHTTRSQAVISAGQGAAAALDILSAVHGKEYNDFDTPPSS